MSKIIVNTANGCVIANDVSNSSLVAQSYVESESSDGLQQNIEKLSFLVNQLVKQIPEQKAEQVSRDLKALITEASSSQPRKKWYELSADGIIEAAKASAALVEPITSTVKQVLDILAM